MIPVNNLEVEFREVTFLFGIVYIDLLQPFCEVSDLFVYNAETLDYIPAFEWAVSTYGHHPLADVNRFNNSQLQF